MRIKHFSFALILAALFMCVATTQNATAQTVEARGKITLRAADGAETPVDKAVVTIYRTDIKGKYEVKTNKKGEYVRVGLPFGGTYTVVVSAPGARPSYQSGVRFGQIPELNFTLEAGDGRVITLEEAQAANAAATTATGSSNAGAAPSAPRKESAEEREAREKFEREVKEVETKNARATDLNAKLPEILKTGNTAFMAKKYDEAITAYDQGIAADPDQGVFHLNKSIALRQRGEAKYIAAGKLTEAEAKKAGRDAARADLKLATEEADKSIAAYKKVGGGSGAAPTAGAGNQAQAQMLDALFKRVETYRLAMQISTPDLGDRAVTAIQEYAAVETDKAKKDKVQATLPQALLDGGKTKEAIEAYRQVIATSPDNVDALYGLGKALASDGNDSSAVIDAFRQFLAKAKGAEYAQQRKDAEDNIAAFEGAMTTDQEQKKKPAPTSGRRRGN